MGSGIHPCRQYTFGGLSCQSQWLTVTRGARESCSIGITRSNPLIRNRHRRRRFPGQDGNGPVSEWAQNDRRFFRRKSSSAPPASREASVSVLAPKKIPGTDYWFSLAIPDREVANCRLARSQRHLGL